MASFVILGSIRSNLSQEIMNNQTVSEAVAGAGSQLRLVYSARGEADAASPVLIIVYLSFLLTAVILSIVSNNRARRREQEAAADTVAVRSRGRGCPDKPPSYTNIFFNEEPPQYHEIVCYESGGSTPVPGPRSDLIIL